MLMPTNGNPNVLDDAEELVDAVLGASRALVAVAARSLGDLDEDVTLVQYRVLVELAARGPQNVAELAAIVSVSPSTMTRMCDRLVRKGLALRRRAKVDRRIVRISLAPAGREIVTTVTKRRRDELSDILERLASKDRQTVLVALRAFTVAAGTLPEQEWSLGWNIDRALMTSDNSEP